MSQNILCLRLPIGPTGPAGSDGNPGPTGAPGLDGNTGPTGSVAQDVALYKVSTHLSPSGGSFYKIPFGVLQTTTNYNYNSSTQEISVNLAGMYLIHLNLSFLPIATPGANNIGGIYLNNHVISSFDFPAVQLRAQSLSVVTPLTSSDIISFQFYCNILTSYTIYDTTTASIVKLY